MPHATAATAWAALAVAMGIGRFAFTPILPMMQEEFGLPVAAGGWLAAANYAGYFIGALWAIRLRLAQVTAIRAGLLVIGLSTLAMGWEHQLALWLALRLAAGIASAWVLVFVSAWALERLALAGRSDLGGSVYAGVGAGIVITGGACLAVARSTDAWLWLGALSLAITAAIWPMVKGSPSSAQALAPVPAIRWSAEFRRLVLCYGTFGFGYIIPATFLPAMAKEITADPRQFGWAWPMFGAAAVVSTLFAAPVQRILSHRSVWIWSQFLMALGVVVPLAVPGLPGILLAALLVGGTFMVITMAGMQEARRVAGSQARALMAAMTAAFALGQILGPALISLLVQAEVKFAPALALAAGLLALSAISLLQKETQGA